jgi:hypothetical protein
MYYIYEQSSTYIIGKPDRNGVARPDHRQSYKTMAAAKAALTRIAKVEPDYDPTRYAIAETGVFHDLIEKTVVKKSAMPPYKEFEERVNTPYYCSPSSETYWSM